MNPTDGAKQVLVASRRRGATCQTVVDRHGEEAKPRPLRHVDGAFAGVRFVAGDPAAAVDGDDCREGPFALRIGDIGQQAGAQYAAVKHVLPGDDLERLAVGQFSRTGRGRK